MTVTPPGFWTGPTLTSAEYEEIKTLLINVTSRCHITVKVEAFGADARMQMQHVNNINGPYRYAIWICPTV